MVSDFGKVMMMPPHCDSMSGPVVTAAREALDAGNVEIVLPYVHAENEGEVRRAFARVLPLRAVSPEVAGVADQWFFENVVRVHRAGERAPYTGLKPAGTDEGPVIPLAEKAIAAGSVEELHTFLDAALRSALQDRLAAVTRTAGEMDGTVRKARAHVEAMLGFEVYSHHLYQAIRSPAEHG